MWNLALKSLKMAHEKHTVEVHAFVLMSNHYHLVVKTPNSNIDLFMYEFNKHFSLKLRKATNLINKMFGGRYKWSVIDDRQHYSHVMKYVLLNPVRAGITALAGKYPYSSLNCNEFPVPLSPFLNIKSAKFIDWLNFQHSDEQQATIKKGLLRRSFKLMGSREDRIPPSFDNLI